MATESQDRDGVQSLRRAFEILELLADLGGSASLSELSTRSGMPRPTIHRLIRTLLTLGYVRRNANRHYALGSRFLRLGEGAGLQLGSWAKPSLVDLVEQTGETANLAILEGDEVVYIGQAPSRHAMRMFTEIGRRLLPHGTGVGKAILSTLPDTEIRALLARTGMPAYTEHTHTELESFLRHLQTIDKQGYALDESEQEIGVRCIAAPLTTGSLRAAISVSGPEGRLTPEAVSRVAPLVRQAAQHLSQKLTEQMPAQG